MKRTWLLHVCVALCFITVPALAQTEPVALTAAARSIGASSLDAEVAALIPSDPSIPAPIRDAMRKSQIYYLEGSTLLKNGESAKAREAFNKAVDLLLQSQWDLTSNPTLSQFFQDLICRIQQEESRFLQPEEGDEEKPEGAVVDELDKVEFFPLTIDTGLKDVVEADLANAKFDIPIVLNEKVLQSLNFWLTRGRRFYTDGLMRSGKYKDMIQRVFKEASLPLDLMYLAQVESLFKTNALSRTQNKGIWQFGKWTAIRYGLKVNKYIDERSDPEKSTRAAAAYLRDLYGMFKDWNLVLAAYNWGEARVQRLIEKSGVNDFWDLMGLRRNFPEETKNHVPLIMASIILAKNPEKYGLPKDLDQPLAYDRVPVVKPIDLKAAAKVLGTTLEELKTLNPALRGQTTPAEYPDFQLKIPTGADPSAAMILARLPAARFKAPPPEPGNRHKVQPGDTLAKIASQYRISVAALQEANDIQSPKSLRVGSWLNIPGKRATGKTKSASIKRAPIKSKLAPILSASSHSKNPIRSTPGKTTSQIIHSPANLSKPASKVASTKGKTGRPIAQTGTRRGAAEKPALSAKNAEAAENRPARSLNPR